MDKVTPLLIALSLDVLFGEPPRFAHPTVWFGKVVEFVDSRYRRRGRFLDFIAGMALTLFLIAFAYLLSLPPPLKPYLLFTSISFRDLVDHAVKAVKFGEVRRERVQMLVSRDVSGLSRGELCSAVIESVSENFVDALFAPLFYYTLFGVKGALIYRAVNTCDAMIGYRGENYEYFGKFCARLDDILNFIPARLSAFLFLPIKLETISIVRRYRRVKLNGGYPMSAMAAVLSVKLVKRGCYTINEGNLPGPRDVLRALDVLKILFIESSLIYTLINLPFESITYLPNLGFISGMVLCSTPMRYVSLPNLNSSSSFLILKTMS